MYALKGGTHLLCYTEWIKSKMLTLYRDFE